MQATIFVRDLVVNTVIGICDWEQEVEQPLIFDIDMQVDATAVAASDSIEDALDYAAVANRVDGFVKAHSAKLLEPLVQDLISVLLAEYRQVQELRVRVRKPRAIASASCAGVEMLQSRHAMEFE